MTCHFLHGFKITVLLSGFGVDCTAGGKGAKLFQEYKKPEAVFS
jgi:hypothetical protein